jgi:2-phosphoglycerate kinase
MPSNLHMRARLTNVRWIGGGSGAGKSTVAARLATEHGLELYATDATIRTHFGRSTPSTHPLVHAFSAMSMDERWLDRSPAEMVRTFHGFQGEGFEMIVEDLTAMAATGPVLAEGFRLLPRLVAPLLAAQQTAVWLLPTPRFRRFALEGRATTAAMLQATSDPARAFENLLDRDALFTEALRAETEALGLQTIEIDLGGTVEAVTARVAVALGLRRDLEG